MPRKFKKELPLIDLGEETMGQRISKLRKTFGLTQVELAKKIGIKRDLLSSYELGKLNLSAEMIARFAIALNSTTDELIGLKSSKVDVLELPSLKIMKRLRKIDNLSPMKQKVLLKMIDGYLKENNM